MLGNVFKIQRFCIDDGEGIRTTVFLKGCPLRCQWCHNPESQSKDTEIFYDLSACIGCGNCVNTCPQNAHQIQDGVHLFDRTRCLACGACANACYANALTAHGEKMTAEEIMQIVERDIPFYQKSGGGLTISGGEPLFQPTFTLEICSLAKKAGIHVCVETSGYGDTQDLLALIPYVDSFLFDFKFSGNKNVEQYIGASDVKIRKNLSVLNEAGGDILLRCPIIPNVNFTNDHFFAIETLAKKTKNIREIHLLPYHPLGIEKAKGFGKKILYINFDVLPSELLKAHAERLRASTGLPVKIF